MNRATIVRALVGTTTRLDHRPTMTEAQETVGGYFQLLKAKDRMTGKAVILVVNEDGKPMGLPLNWRIMSDYDLPYAGAVVGDVIVLEGWQTVGS